MTDRTGKRKSRMEISRRRVPKLGCYFIATDTKETEYNYLVGLRDSIPDELQGRLVIKVIKTRTAGLVEKVLEMASMQPQYGEPWIVFDKDLVADFDSIIGSAEEHGVYAGWSNPCIEIWFHAYFGKMPHCIDSTTCCKRFSETYRRAAAREYKKSDAAIYSALRHFGNEEKAISVAAQRMKTMKENGVNLPSKMEGASTLYMLVDEIRGKTERGT